LSWLCRKLQRVSYQFPMSTYEGRRCLSHLARSPEGVVGLRVSLRLIPRLAPSI
jgi:hypothetical protein